ncbi:ABC transporter permease [Peloplasma aerotolerans]|uniref:ABC transporter permease n=1 Tax=Peloplasma aerotolerans TaxID=3044389 RepID=A0AAW6U229_9MOLU|nr:ABC transporter permease [Mariniplasma sp. M4Ah]MDI6451957.1 ABC transporter permease [Mariniplasma sp. M4Ah]MDR4968747.1 ABC transporter permease [Acholeplasmataceae bacterium]
MNNQNQKEVSKFKKHFTSFFRVIKPSLISIGTGLFIGLIIMIIFDPRDAFPALFTLIGGGFIGGIKGVGDMLEMAAPIMLAGLAVAFAFKTGLFNIGASGQMMMGALASLFVGILVQLPPFQHLMLALFVGIVAGAIWGFIPGILKATRHVNEVVASIMMNYIALYIFTTLVTTYLSQGTGSNSTSRPVQISAALPRLSTLFPGSTANIGIFIAIGVIIIAHIIIHKTTLGFSLRASGFSFEGSRYAGMNTKANIVIAMTLSGLFAGLGGSILYLVRGKTIADFHIFTEGFDGISVALLGLGEPIGALFAGLFLANIRMGGFYMQLYSYSRELIDMIVAIIIYSIAITAAIQMLLKRFGYTVKTFVSQKILRRPAPSGGDNDEV